MRRFKVQDLILDSTFSTVYHPLKRTRFGRAPKEVPKVGKRFGNLTVRGYWIGAKGRLSAIEVQCDCGSKPWPVLLSNLRKGATKRCNACSIKQRAKANRTAHGYEAVCPNKRKRESLLSRIRQAIRRCHNPKSKLYPDYGGRGIAVYKPWRIDLVSFLVYVSSLDGSDDLSNHLDRIDNDRGYEPGNLRFVSASDNMFNKRTASAIERKIRSLDLEIAALKKEYRLEELALWSQQMNDAFLINRKA